MIKKIEHIGVAVKDLEKTEKFYSEILSLDVSDGGTYGDLKVSFLPVGDVRIELLQSTMPNGLIAKFIDKKGEGVHHIAYEVDNINKALEDLQAKGVELIDKQPRIGAHNSKVAFINPKSSYGILVELVELETK
jgi:methylmalonyl-CoA/ethylmalonyl-CoA epimerase